MILSSLFSCNSQQNNNIERLEVTSFKEYIENKEVQLIDVRTPEEYEQGAIKNAKLINFFGENFKSEVSKLNKKKPVYLYCKGGGRSKKASKVLADLGFTKVYDLKGGYMAWESNGN